jgi:hypothetical protein
MTAARTATLVQTLVFYDGPQVALLKSSRNLDMLAVAVEKPQYLMPFFSCEIRDRTLKKYANGKIDLNYAFEFADYKKYYFFDWSAMDESRKVRLNRASDEDVSNQAYYPQAGFFARDHTNVLKSSGQVNAASIQKVFNIDGSWEASEFSRFYGKISDLYAFLYVAKKQDEGTLNPVDTAAVKDAISSQFWRGGGSYVKFYDAISERVGMTDPLTVAKIAYASPGEIVLKGRSEIFHELDQMVASFGAHFEAIKSLSSNVDGILKKEGLRRALKHAKFSSGAMEQSTKEQALKLANLMVMEKPQQILALCENNTLVFSKVVLSFYRRARDLFLFHAEGRVQSDDVEED